MSAPVYDDGDKRTMYAPPWARDPQRDDVETRRLQTEIIAAAERLKPPEPPAPPQPVQRPASPQDKDFQTRFLGDRPGKPKADPADHFEDEIRAVWQPSLLDPVPMPPPPKPEIGGPTWGMVSRLAGAAGFAAIVALFVAGAIPLPSIEFSLSRDPADANAAAPLVAAGNSKQLAVAPQPPAAATAAPQPAAPAAQTVALAPVAPPLPPAPPRQKTEAESALPEARVLDYMSAEEIEGLLKRGQDLIATGDISGGRLLLTRAAEAGEPRASLALAATYDSAVVAGLGVIGAFPDSVKARAWYAKAASQGNAEAARRLEQPHLRQR